MDENMRDLGKFWIAHDRDFVFVKWYFFDILGLSSLAGKNST